jgi:hypothetical protein
MTSVSSLAGAKLNKAVEGEGEFAALQMNLPKLLARKIRGGLGLFKVNDSVYQFFLDSELKVRKHL